MSTTAKCVEANHSFDIKCITCLTSVLFFQLNQAWVNVLLNLSLLRPAIFKQSSQSCQLFVQEHYSAIYCYQTDSFTVVIMRLNWQSGLQKTHEIRFSQIGFKPNLKLIWNAIPSDVHFYRCVSVWTLDTLKSYLKLFFNATHNDNHDRMIRVPPYAVFSAPYSWARDWSVHINLTIIWNLSSDCDITCINSVIYFTFTFKMHRKYIKNTSNKCNQN